MTPSLRPNCVRSVYAFGVFDDNLLARVVPQVMALRAQSDESITVFINSPGGVIRSLEVLDGCLQDTDLQAHTCTIITVATGDAASAAATLLALGDYSYAYPRSEIHFHGARLAEMETITTESAASIANYLANRNRQIAFRLANAIVRRLGHRYSIVQEDFARIRGEDPDDEFSDLECFVQAIDERVGSRASQVLLDTFSKAKSAINLTKAILGRLDFPSGSSKLQQDAQVFQAVLDHELSQPADTEWRLDDLGCSKIVTNYLLVRDYRLGEHRRALKWITTNLGLSFLTEDEIKHLFTLKEEEEGKKYLSETVRPRLLPFWYFTVCLARRLQEGENRLSPEDAYWLGIVDEVIGTKLQGVRAIIEDPDPPAPTSDVPNETA